MLDREKKITFVSTALAMGGAEVQVSHLARSLKRRNWEVSVISMTTPVALVDTLENEGVAVRSLDMQPGLPNPFFVFSLAKLLKEFQPSVVHSHMVHANILSRVSRATSPSFSQPLVCTAHNTIEGGKWVERAYRMTDKFCNLTTNVSQAAVDRYIKIGAAPANRIRLMRNGLDTSQFLPDEGLRSSKRKELGLEDRLICLAVGRLTEAKNYGLLIDSFFELKTRIPSAVLLIVGEGEEEDELKGKASSLGLGDENLRWLGRRHDVSELMKASDLYVMSSLWEGLPMVLLEASASGLAIVATDVGGNSEIVQDGINGFIVDSGNQDGLVKAMDIVLSMSKNERMQLGSGGRKFVQMNYDLDLIVDQWESIYNEVRGLS